VENYGRHIDRFLAQRFGTGPVRFEQLRAKHVIAFVQREAGLHSRGYILQVVTGLRSFLRFLRYRGDITTDLAAAVPSVANWQKTGLPKHLPADAVQTVLDGCDLTTAVGRRDYAILLLLARLGLRGGEVVTLQLEDIDWDNGQITIRSKKGSGWARLPLPSDVGKSDLTLSQAGPPPLFVPKRLRPHGCTLSAYLDILRHLGFDPERDPTSMCRVGAERGACFPPQSGVRDAPAGSLFG